MTSATRDPVERSPPLFLESDIEVARAGKRLAREAGSARPRAGAENLGWRPPHEGVLIGHRQAIPGLHRPTNALTPALSDELESRSQRLKALLRHRFHRRGLAAHWDQPTVALWYLQLLRPPHQTAHVDAATQAHDLRGHDVCPRIRFDRHHQRAAERNSNGGGG